MASSSSAAAAASPFSFHCMICFEEFHSESRFPVILPCGHTYVCNVCSERLDKCMECRTPLVMWTVPPPQKPAPRLNQNNALGNSNRWSRTASSTNSNRRLGANNDVLKAHLPTPPPVPQKTRVPLPKNVVLLSLMEATELTTEREKPASPLPSTMTASLNNQEEDDMEEEDNVYKEEQMIREGTSLAVSGCGTYVVTCKDGLLIYPIRPNSKSTSSSSKNGNFGNEEDVDTLVRFFHLDHHTDSEEANQEEGQLRMGDRIQIVSVEGGWAKLARGYGFIQADASQIVKVGGSMDRACVLEAMLHSLSIRRKELRREQSKVDSRFVIAMNELQTSLLNDEDLTVIVGETFAQEEQQQREMMKSSSLLGQDEDDDSDSVEVAVGFGPKQTRENNNNLTTTPPPTPLTNNNNTESASREPESIRVGDYDISQPIALARQETPQFLLQSNSVIGCGFPSLGLPELSSSPARVPPQDANNKNDSAGMSSTTRSNISFNQSQMSAGARAWRERHGRPASNGIDFRTGLSGHMALLSTHAHPHEYLNRNANMLGMSNHTGLSMSKSVRKAPSFPPDG